MTRTGKIARLPRDIRHALNIRLEDGEPDPDILRWLNKLPNVKSVLKSHFDSRPISAQNS